MADAQFNPKHPHEPAVAPVFDAEGRCLVCALSVAQRASARLELVSTRAAGVFAMLSKRSPLPHKAREKCGRLSDELMAAVEACPAPDARLSVQELRNAGMENLAGHLEGLLEDDDEDDDATTA